MDRDELDRLGLVKSAEEEAPPAEQEAAEERVSPGRAQHAPVPEGMQLIPAETLERLVNIAASYAEAGERIGRAEAERDVYRERLDESRAEAERLRAEVDELRAGRQDEAEEDVAAPAAGAAVGDRLRGWWRRSRWGAGQ